jgi:hypothetical protein
MNLVKGTQRNTFSKSLIHTLAFVGVSFLDFAFALKGIVCNISKLSNGAMFLMMFTITLTSPPIKKCVFFFA